MGAICQVWPYSLSVLSCWQDYLAVLANHAFYKDEVLVHELACGFVIFSHALPPINLHTLVLQFQILAGTFQNGFARTMPLLSNPNLISLLLCLFLGAAINAATTPPTPNE